MVIVGLIFVIVLIDLAPFNLYACLGVVVVGYWLVVLLLNCFGVFWIYYTIIVWLIIVICVAGGFDLVGLCLPIVLFVMLFVSLG